MGVSVLFLVSFKPLEELKLELPRSLLIVMVLICVLVAMITFFGWYGAYKESPGLLYLYAGIVTVLFLVGIGIVAALGTSITSIEQAIDEFIVPYALKLLDAEDTGMRSIVDIVGDLQSGLGW